ALDGKALLAGASSSASAPDGATLAALPTATTTEQLPVLSIVKSGPQSALVATSATYPLALSNAGSAGASGLAITDSLPGGESALVSGVPASLQAGASANASASYQIPLGHAGGPMSDTAALTWQDANGNAYGPISSSFSTEVLLPPSITAQPQARTADEGQPATFTAEARGYPAPQVQWQLSTTGGLSWEADTTDHASSTSEGEETKSTLTLSSATRAESGYSYRAIFTNGSGDATSSAATLTVDWIGPISAQPLSQTANEGASASFTAAAASNPTATVQWQLSADAGKTWANDTTDAASTSTAIGQTTSTLTVASATRAQNGYEYRALFTNAAGTTTTSAATLTVDWIGPITSQPESQTAVEGKPVSLSAASAANPTASVVWQYSSDSGAEWQADSADSATTTPESGQTKSTLTIASASRAQTGYEYRAIFTNAAGTSTSAAASVMVETTMLCTDNYSGPDNGLWQTAANWSTGKTPTSSDVACVGAGTTVDVTEGHNVAGVLLDQGGLTVAAGSLELSASAALVSIPGFEVSTASTLTVRGGTLSLAGTLEVASSLGLGSISGSGKLIVKPGATGTIEGCGYSYWNGVTIDNEGALTAGEAGGGVGGGIVMENGAQLVNAGTFNEDHYDGFGYYGSCRYEEGGEAIWKSGEGAAPTITNAGIFNVEAGSGHLAGVEVMFSNQGTVNVKSGTLQLRGGGIPEEVATGCWYSRSGGLLELREGTFLLEEGCVFEGLIDGATVKYTPNGLSGSIEAHPYAAGIATITGHGADANASTIFAGATIEATRTGRSEWKPVCGPVTPDASGAFSCAWNTNDGATPGGRYEVRARLSDNSRCPKSIYTTPTAVRVANAPLALSPAHPQPSFVGNTETFTATLSNSEGAPVAGTMVALTIKGADPQILEARTNEEGEATFSYVGKQAGTDSVQASSSPAGGAAVTSNTATVSWLIAQREVSSTPVQGNFYHANDAVNGFSAKPGDTPAFSQTFPNIDFNPPAEALSIPGLTVAGAVNATLEGPFSGSHALLF
ncbi:MAG: immunoglobulin domain-containing protein, partial [Solirubrobacteraceae bacterium]